MGRNIYSFYIRILPKDWHFFKPFITLRFSFAKRPEIAKGLDKSPMREIAAY